MDKMLEKIICWTENVNPKTGKLFREKPFLIFIAGAALLLVIILFVGLVI